MTTLVIDPRFCGPVDSGHGGYSSGVLAAFVDGPAAVRLWSPPPLGRPLDVVESPQGSVELRDPRAASDASPIAVASPRPALALDVPPPPTRAEAAAASARFMWHDRHPFPFCFACGTSRHPDEAWCIAAGSTGDGTTVASPAACPPDLVAADGIVPDEQVWAALDCITAHPLPLAGASLDPPWLLGTYAVDVFGEVRADADLVVMGWALRLDGRKFHSAGALVADGEVLAVSQATWIQMRASPTS